MVNGERATHTFNDATDTIEQESGVETLCGLRTYAITFSSNGAAIDWVTIGPQSPLQTKWDIVAAPVLDAVVGNSNLQLKILLANYPNHPGITIPFVVSVSSPPCECNRIVYDTPGAQTLTTTTKVIQSPSLVINHSTVNADSLIASP